MTDNNDAKAGELIQDYIGPDHKAIDKKAFLRAYIQALRDTGKGG